jgi:hypothetical protein
LEVLIAVVMRRSVFWNITHVVRAEEHVASIFRVEE